MRAIFTVIVLGVVVGCSSEDSGSTSPSGGSGTCESTCSKAIALKCPSTPYDQTKCVSDCKGQESACSSKGMSAQFKTYLDCIQANAMTCGSSGTPQSPSCVSQGMAIIACMMGGDAGTDGG